MNKYTDFFDLQEPSKGDLVYEEIRNVLLGCVRQEILDELEKLRKENAELRPLKEDHTRMEREIERVRADCTKKVNEARTEAENSVFETLLGEHIINAWKVGREYTRPPKCDKCDKDRKLHFQSPRGKDMTEPCECDQSIVTFKPVPALLARFRVKPAAYIKNQTSRDTFYDKPLYYWYTTEYSTLDDAEFVISSCSEHGTSYADDNKPFDKLSEHHSVFTSEQKCKEFCEYLREQREHKTF